MSGLVSIITPVYNSATHLAECITSVKAQSYPHWEHILIDDCSADGSIAIAQQYAEADSRIKVLQNAENLGPAKTRNRGIEVAQGRYIAFLDSDDKWLPEKLSKQIAAMQASNEVLSHTNYERIDQQSEPTGKVITAPAKLSYNKMLNFNYIGCLTAMYDAEQIGKRYFPDVLKRQDYGLWLSIMREGYTALLVPEVLAQYRVGGESLSSNKWDAAQYNWKILREQEGLNPLHAAYRFVRYMLEGVKKYYLS